MNKKLKAIAVCVVALLFACFALTGCENRAGQKQPERVSQTRLMLDTYCTITVYAQSGNPDSLDAIEALVEEAFSLCEHYESLMSWSVEGSDVWRINNAEGAAVTVDGATADVIERGIEFSGLSDGMFDITIGRLSRLWDFGGGNASVPDALQIKHSQATVNYSRVTVTSARNTVQLQDKDAWLDLGGIAKGYIADRIAEHFVGNGINNALIDLGGDIVALGAKPGGEPWRLGVRRPFGGMDEHIGVLEVSGVAVVSSGIYERQFESDGVTYHHILDPKTGYPAESDVVAATVVAADAITGEGLSTIAILAGSERAQEIFAIAIADGFIGAALALNSGETLTIGDVELK